MGEELEIEYTVKGFKNPDDNQGIHFGYGLRFVPDVNAVIANAVNAHFQIIKVYRSDGVIGEVDITGRSIKWDNKTDGTTETETTHPAGNPNGDGS